MKKENKILTQNKRLLPLLASVALLSGPVLVTVACNHEISRYQAALSNDLQNRLLFDFVGVNYNVSADSQFKNIFKQGMDFIKKDVEGIMAKQEFLNFFVQKLNYSEEKALNTFEQIKDNLGLNILANEYFTALNNKENFDNKVYASKLIFQTENWHQSGTLKFNYNNTEFYQQKENNPDIIFTSSYLYDKLDDVERDNKIKEVAKHADDNYNEEIEKLNEGNSIWETQTPPNQFAPPLEKEEGTKNYQKKLERFKWWLRFRYQQYYYSQILPQLNETLFTMANMLDSILRITKDNNGKPKVQIDNNNYASQLQEWGTNASWVSKYHLVWDYNISQTNAIEKSANWENEPLPDLVEKDGKELNINFLTELSRTDQSLKNTVDPTFGVNGFINNPSSKDYSKAVNDQKNNKTSGWITNDDGSHYWGKNKKGSFVYVAPVYWIDVILNLNFNFYNDKNNSITVDADEDYNNLISAWNSIENSPTSSSSFSKYIRSDEIKINDKEYDNYQEMKWNLFWQMLYSLAEQQETNSNKDVAKNNFELAAKALYPKFIKKEKIYSQDFWDAVKSYY